MQGREEEGRGRGGEEEERKRGGEERGGRVGRKSGEKGGKTGYSMSWRS